MLDVNKPETFTPQRIFDHVVIKLAEQGRRSIKNGDCVYIGPNGRCAAGHVLPDELIEIIKGTNYASQSITMLFELFRSHTRHLREFQWLLLDLQIAHDSYQGLIPFKNFLREVAKKHGLKAALVGTITHWEIH